jgi:hypothetical protein
MTSKKRVRSDTFEIVLNDCHREFLFDFQKFFFHVSSHAHPKSKQEIELLWTCRATAPVAVGL